MCLSHLSTKQVCFMNKCNKHILKLIKTLGNHTTKFLQKRTALTDFGNKILTTLNVLYLISKIRCFYFLFLIQPFFAGLTRMRKRNRALANVLKTRRRHAQPRLKTKILVNSKPLLQWRQKS